MRASLVDRMTCILGSAGMVVMVSVVMTDPALAVVRPGPAPLIGVGLPLVGGVLAAIMVVRRFRRKD